MKYHSSHGELTKTSFDQDFSFDQQQPMVDDSNNPNPHVGPEVKPRMSAEVYNIYGKMENLGLKGDIGAAQHHYPSDGNPEEVGLTPEATEWLLNMYAKQIQEHQDKFPQYAKEAEDKLHILQLAMQKWPAKN
jgi:hypothetical protein